MRAFISYSHKDHHILERLHIHLVQLRRENLITEWCDREISAGGNIDQTISEELENCDLFIPLISPDFLASNYCYDIEMKRALERHNEGEALVIPIIVEPSDWQSTPLKNIKVLPKDGNPIVEWTNQNNAFLDITQHLRKITSEPKPNEFPEFKTDQKQNIASERYRIKKDFDEIDKKDFVENTFNKIKKFFIENVEEINLIDGIKAKYQEIDANKVRCIIVNKEKSNDTAYLNIFINNGSNLSFGDINISHSENPTENSVNGCFRVENDDYEQYYSSNLFTFSNIPEKLSETELISHLWSDLLSRVGINYD